MSTYFLYGSFKIIKITNLVSVGLLYGLTFLCLHFYVLQNALGRSLLMLFMMPN